MGELALLWHLHQPDYRDPATGRPLMPWTRLHALRGYRDLLVESVEEGLPVTINIVPVLIDQLLHYADGGDDRHLELTRRDVLSLGPEEITEICQTFPIGHHAMSDAHPAYRRLRARVEAGHRPSRDELRDLQVWSTLAWFGATAARDFPEIGELRAKGVDFDERDKTAMLAVQEWILTDIPRLLRALVTTDGPAVSTSAYYHPILPLVIDCRHARRSMPDLPDVDFSWPEDALRQLVDARARMEEVLGIAPVGLWPSEGGVSPETVELAVQAGFRWLATDEGILQHSSCSRARPGPGGWELGHGMRGFFRDRDLSDRIGFHYAEADPVQAAADLLRTARERAGDGVLLVALDGENPWESFRDAGAAFRSALYQGLHTGALRGITLDEAAQREPVGRITRLHSGSWIHADFHIWIGHEDDRRAWHALNEARLAVERSEEPERRETAMRHLLAAEGSDWMWWYGTEFVTPFARQFDQLFREHLQAAWKAVGEDPPPSLQQSIGRATALTITHPARPITPSLVEEPAWIDWTGAGELGQSGGSMAVGVRHVDRLRFGWSQDGALWLRIDLARPLPSEGEAVWRIEVDGRAVELPYGLRAQIRERGIEARAGQRTIIVRADAGETARVRVVRPDSSTDYPTRGSFLLPKPDPLAWVV